MERNEDYVILQEETYDTSEAGDRYRIVLGHKGGRFPQYVTWESTVYNEDRAKAYGKDIVYFWGHYYEDHDAALAKADYHKRLMTRYEQQ